MQQIYTEDDLIRYIYNEISQPERQRIEIAMEKEPSLRSAYSQMMEVINRMDSVKMNPSTSSIELILEHSTKTSSHLEASL